MKKISYLLFPKILIIIGIIFLILVFYNLIGIVAFWIAKGGSEELFFDIGRNTGGLLIGLILITTRTIIICDSETRTIRKRMTLLWITMSNESIKVPNNCSELIVKGKVKRGTSYVSMVVPLSYDIKSFELYLEFGGRMKKIISTDYKRGKIIAEALHETMNISYQLK